jgi:uncharacterized membrane protein
MDWVLLVLVLVLVAMFVFMVWACMDAQPRRKGDAAFVTGDGATGGGCDGGGGGGGGE